mmetsp:Transcript_102402/g.305842  ORF Transcript_102402/g.305842 Transcript_102402/m.305842 type:complete len:278 (+) Transcript_102402:57-890(+)
MHAVTLLPSRSCDRTSSIKAAPSSWESMTAGMCTSRPAPRSPSGQVMTCSSWPSPAWFTTRAPATCACCRVCSLWRKRQEPLEITAILPAYRPASPRPSSPTRGVQASRGSAMTTRLLAKSSRDRACLAGAKLKAGTCPGGRSRSRRSRPSSSCSGAVNTRSGTPGRLARAGMTVWFAGPCASSKAAVPSAAPRKTGLSAPQRPHSSSASPTAPGRCARSGRAGTRGPRDDAMPRSSIGVPGSCSPRRDAFRDDASTSTATSCCLHLIGACASDWSW